MIFRLLYKGRCHLRRSRDILQKGQTDKKKDEPKEEQNIIDLSKIDITNPKSVKETIDKLKQNLERPSEPKPQQNNPIKQEKSNKFPYKYGGVSKYDPNDDFIHSASKGRIKTFENMYGSFLDAVEKKNKRWLQTNTVPGLVDPLLIPNSLYQLHKSSPIRLLFSNLSLIIGSQIKQNASLKKVANEQNIGLYMKDSNLANISSDSMTLGLPVMVSYKIVFLSSRRLSPKEDSKQLQQAHIIRLSQDLRLDVFKMMSLMKTLNQQSVSDEVKTLLLDSNNPWVITNVDSFLRENYN